MDHVLAPKLEAPRFGQREVAPTRGQHQYLPAAADRVLKQARKRPIVAERRPFADDQQTLLHGGDRIDVGHRLERNVRGLKHAPRLLLGVEQPDVQRLQPFLLSCERRCGEHMNRARQRCDRFALSLDVQGCGQCAGQDNVLLRFRSVELQRYPPGALYLRVDLLFAAGQCRCAHRETPEEPPLCCLRSLHAQMKNEFLPAEVFDQGSTSFNG